MDKESIAAAAITGLLGLAGIVWSRRGQRVTDSATLALEIAKETRDRQEKLEAREHWWSGALTTYADHIDLLRAWIADGNPPPPPPRPVLPPRPE